MAKSVNNQLYELDDVPVNFQGDYVNIKSLENGKIAALVKKQTARDEYRKVLIQAESQTQLLELIRITLGHKRHGDR